MTSTPKCFSGNYILAPQADTTTILTLVSGSIYINGVISPPIILDSTSNGSSQVFTIGGDSEYAEGYVTITYTPSGGTPQTAECHINFFLTDTSWNQDTSGSFPNDNNTIIPTTSIPPTSGEPTLISVTQPTGGSSSGVDTLYQVLNPDMVFLVDYYPENKTMLFRGNTPFNTPATNNGQQSVDFETLHTYMKAKYESQTGETDFPAFNTYKLRDVCLQSTNSEGGSILWELDSFGGNNLSELTNQVWYPADVNGAQNQMCNWEIEPHNAQPNDVFDLEAVQKLSNWMSPETIPDTYHIYYIHCASGHDRTGIVASAYMIANRSLSLSRSLIYGTTIAKLSNGSGQLQVNCTDLDGTNQGKIDPNRSRITMIANVYDETVLNIYNSIVQPTTPVTQLPEQAMATNPANVYSTYPWQSPKIQANQTWQNTGILVTEGDAISIDYKSGLWTADPKTNGGNLYDASGCMGITVNQVGYTLLGVNMGALCGYVGSQPVGDGSDAAFLVGDSYSETSGTSGELWLCINDDLKGKYGSGLSDNSGSVTLMIAVS